MPLPLNLLPASPAPAVPGLSPENCPEEGACLSVADSTQPFGSLLGDVASRPLETPPPTTEEEEIAGLAAVPQPASSPTAEQLAAILAFLAGPNPSPAAPLPVTADLAAGIDGLSEAAVLAGQTAPAEPQSETKSAGRFVPQTLLSPGAGKGGPKAIKAEPSPTACRQAVISLLVRGTPTIDFQLQPAAPAALSTVAAPATLAMPPPIATNGQADTAVPVAADTPTGVMRHARPESRPQVLEGDIQPAEIISSPALTAASSQLGDEVERALGSRQGPRIGSIETRTEKIADPGAVAALIRSAGGISPVDPRKNMSLRLDEQRLKLSMPPVGTSAANWGVNMNPQRSTDDSFNVAAAQTFAGFASPSAAQAPDAASALAPAAASHAAELVHEIREIADGMWAIDRNSVEVRFKFDNDEGLAVRVEYRDGTVKATFRTDSEQLRELIAREWQSQVAGADSRAYRMADPIFEARPAAADSLSSDAGGSRQQSQGEPRSSDQGGFSTHFSLSNERSGSATTLGTSPATDVRPDTAHHLHTFA